jgi:hypothetical protein
VAKGFTNDAIPALSACESPIEGKFVQAVFDYFSRITGVKFRYFHDQLAKCSVMFSSTMAPDAPVATAYLQYAHPILSGGRADVLLKLERFCCISYLVVELDGVAFHSTEEQVKLDRRRDRILLAEGIPVMRFTGSDVYMPAAALDAVTLALNAAFLRLPEELPQ